jgi:hypothetical protein
MIIMMTPPVFSYGNDALSGANESPAQKSMFS